MTADERTYALSSDPMPADLSNCTYLSRDALCQYLRHLADCDHGPFDPEARHDNAVNALLAYICDLEITQLFNEVPAL